MIKELSYEAVSLAINSFAEKKATIFGLELDPQAPAYMQLSNYLSKLIEMKPRSVAVSTNFNVPEEHLAGYKNLVRKIENGENVNIYLSKGIEKTMFSDRFLDDYGCVHLHLGEILENNYIQRTGPVALAFVTDHEIFFIETKLHGKDHPYTWSNKSVLEILHTERPHFISRNKVSALKNISPVISNEKDIKNLRNNGYAFGVTLNDGSVYMPAKFGPVTVQSSNKKKNSSLASEHMLHMMHCTREIYFFINRYIKKYKLEMNCTITNIEISNLRSNKDDSLTVDQFDIQIHYLKEFSLMIHTNSFSR